ncbi:MAG: hypothetical protein HOY71_46450, partial [Nonomuraea sp.]|nr:hypothetical protein [Nonomuraea sp.]
RAAAGALGLELRLRPRWDDDAVAGLVGADPDTHPITAVIDLGGPR